MRDADSVDATLVALAKSRNAALVCTDSDEWPSFADVTADFVYARLMRARSKLTTGYTKPELKQWAERVRETRPDHLLVLPWNLQAEVLEQMSFIREWGGRFIVPIPEPKIQP